MPRRGVKPEKIMPKSAYRAAVVAAFSGSIAVATATEFTIQQKQAIMQGVLSEKGQPVPLGFQIRVGAPVPPSISMRQLPSDVTRQVPAVKDMEYAKLDNNEILLIDPKDRRIADVLIFVPGTTPPPASPR